MKGCKLKGFTLTKNKAELFQKLQYVIPIESNKQSLVLLFSRSMQMSAFGTFHRA